VKESRYVKMARTILQILKHSRIPFFIHRKSNHIYTVWQQQHVIFLLAIRQYKGRKSYHGMFAADWLIEACYLMRMFIINLSKIIPHSFYNITEIRRQNNNRYHIGKKG
jgi:hypothetical protein